MPVSTAGNILFTKAVAFGETTYGTIPTLTSGGRRLVTSPTGIINPGTNIEVGQDRSVALRNPILSSTNVVVSQEPTISLDAPSLSLEDWVFYLQGIKAVSPVGAANPYTWTYDISMTASNSPKSYSIVMTDGVQAFVTNYSMLTSLSISADRNGLTTARAEFFAQSLAKDSTTLADTVQSSVTYMPGRLWKPYFHTSFPSVSEGTAYSYLLDWSLDITPGNARQAYQNGTLTMATHAESEPFTGNIQMTVSANASAISELYDAYQSATTKYLRLEWTNGLASTALRSANICLAFIPTEVTPIANAEDGLTTVTVQGQLVTDVATSKTLLVELKNGLSTAP
jgi:hypothetical protein